METKTASQLVAEARARIRNLTVEQVASQIETGNVVLVDVREPGELAEQGAIAGAVHAPRGMLEFYADPTSPDHRSELDRRPAPSCTAPPVAARRWPVTCWGGSAMPMSPTSTAASRRGRPPAGRWWRPSEPIKTNVRVPP
jgi:rhodanese-related sulfurtransferase